MEILIPGLILVALMVYVSTRIKRSAAQAFEAETIETDEFVITKPDGFIIPTGGTSALAFAGYSKDFGTDDADAIRQVSAELAIFENETLAGVRTLISDRASKIGVEQRFAGGGLVIETEEIENGIGLDCEYRVYEKNGKIYQLAIKSLPEFKAEQQKNIDTLIASFEVK